MSYSITEETFSTISSYWTGSKQSLNWRAVFVLPAWLKAWWQEFGTGMDLYLRTIRQEDEIVGIAPLMINEDTAYFTGSSNVCDYLDFIITPGRETDFFNVLLDNLKQDGITKLDLQSLRPDSSVLKYLKPTAQERGYETVIQQEDVSSEVILPATWDDYLAMLNKKQRHELRRKLRRLEEIRGIDYHCIIVNTDNVKEYIDTFLKLFPLSREDKANFMDVKMESFFRSIAEAMAEIQILKFGILKRDSLIVSMIMAFDYNESVYLYNSAYDPEYDSLSVGILCKALCIKNSIQENKKIFDFLKGAEPYKYHLNGKQFPIFRCQIDIK